MKPEYRIRIRDVNLQFIGEVTDYISLQYTLRMNALGKWVLTLPFKSESTQQLLGLLVPGNKGVGGIYVERNNQYLFSGPLLDHEYSFDQNGEVMTFIGGDEMDFIARSLALAHPRIFQSPFMKDAAGNHTDYTPNDRQQQPGEPSRSSSEVFWDIFEKNKAQSADPTRRIPQLYMKFTTGSANDVGSERYPSGDLSTFPNPNPIVTRGDPMMDILQQIVNYSESTVYNPDGTVWKPPHPIILDGKMVYNTSIGNTYNGGWWIVFEFRACPDKTNSIIFSKGNVISLRRTQTAPTANIIQMGGSGDGADRVFAHSGDEPSRQIYGDREGFASFSGYQYSTTDPTHKEQIEELKPHLYDELRKSSSQTTIEAEVIDKEGMEYHKDWFLGDKVRVETPISSDIVIIREIDGTVDANGENIRVRIGTAPAPLYGLNDKKKTAHHAGWIQNLFKRTGGE